MQLPRLPLLPPTQLDRWQRPETEKQSAPELAAAHYAKAIDYWELLAANGGIGEEIECRLIASRTLLEEIRETTGSHPWANASNTQARRADQEPKAHANLAIP